MRPERAQWLCCRSKIILVVYKGNKRMESARWMDFRKGLAVLLVFCLFAVSGCSSMSNFFSELWPFGKKGGPDTEEALAEKALDSFEHGNYFNALDFFEKIKSQYPFGPYSLVAELKAADCQYFMEHYQEAITLYQEFEERHPTNEAVPYVIFQTGMSHFRRIDRVDRDVSGAASAVQVFSRLLRAYPLSPYTTEAKERMVSAENVLAAHEFAVADFYLRTNEVDQAKNRLQYILISYPDSSVASAAQQNLADLNAGRMPEKSWKDWLPSFSLPEWTSLAAWGFAPNPKKSP